ncbi:36623_t:CDS:2 [Gigaspora margarita]|uniref:60S ribosomal protein L6 n=1 Tax=Gigaspora margarita TaxID=4874 RepID=A0ABN7UQQ1_GIGMA|nr:36623_t:CDS:2 [Gigaspora margarita]
MAHAPRNRFLVPGIPRYSRCVVYAKKALYKKSRKGTFKKAETKHETTKKVPFKDGHRIVPLEKAPRFYPAEDIPRPKKCRKVNKPAKLRPSITPGTILILLAGRFRGKRVVFLRQLPSGLLLVTGPFKINGVPLRRVNQAFVIATSTKIDISACSLDKFNDAYFKREKGSSKKVTEEELFGEKQKQKTISESRIADQKEIDSKIIAGLKTPHLKDYLHSRFSLSKGQFPHELVF